MKYHIHLIVGIASEAAIQELYLSVLTPNLTIFPTDLHCRDCELLRPIGCSSLRFYGLELEKATMTVQRAKE